MATERGTTAPTTANGAQEANVNFNLKTCLNDLTKISQNEFEAQFRNWMEKDGVARSMQAKLRADLIRNFNKTNLGKHMLGQTTTNRLTLSPMELALNTLIAEFLFSQDCHFTLSVYSTEAPFRNTIPDLEGSTHFRFQQNEIIEIIKAICGTTNFDWNFKNRIVKDYDSNKKISLLYFILKALLDSNAETRQQKITVGTNTRPFKMPMSAIPPLSSDGGSSKMPHDSKTEFYNTNFRCLNRYLVILSRRVKEMSENFEKLQGKQNANSVPRQPRVRVFKSPGRRKYEDLNRSLERVTENLRQMAQAKRKSKRVGTIVKAIETLSNQFQKCAENFENVSKDLRLSARSSTVHVTKANKSTSAESLKPNGIRHHLNSPTTAAASQTDLYAEKTFGDWLHEMRYTRNGQRFLDRVEKSFLKALERQKRELAIENEVKLKHQRELLRIRYKQKVIEQMYTQSSQSANTKETASANIEPTETISEQFRQFELKHFDLLSKIYESETENRASGNRINKEPIQRNTNSEKLVQFNVKENEPLPRNGFDIEAIDLKLTSSSEYIEQHQPQQCRQVLKEISTNDIQQQVKEAIVELVSEERNVDQIVLDAKIRIKELEHESNQLTENFLGYLDRQRQQKLAAREAAQSLWNDYMSEREKMQKRYSHRDHDLDDEEFMLADIAQLTRTKEHADVQNVKGDMERTLKEHEKLSQDLKKVQKASIQIQRINTSSDDSSSSSYLKFKNPIIQAKQEFFERERKFKAEAEELLSSRKPNVQMNLNEFLSFDNIDEFYIPTTTSTIYPIELTYQQEQQKSLMPALNRKPQILITNSLMAQFLSDSVSGTNTDLSTPNQAIERTTEMSATTSNFQLAANWQSSTLERPQNGSVNKSQRREIIAATATATAKEEIKRMKIQKPATITTNTFVATTKTTTIPTTSTLNNKKNKTNGGATIAEEQQVYSNNYKIKSDAVTTTTAAAIAGYGQRNIIAKEQQEQQEQQRQSEWDIHHSNETNNNNNNNGNETSNKTSNIKSNVLAELRAFVNERKISTIQTSKSSSVSNPEVSGVSGGELSRKAVLKQTMARMQQLFLPHQQQQQIILSDVAEELTNEDDDDDIDDNEDIDKNADIDDEVADDVDESEIVSTKVQKTKISEIKESQNKSNNNYSNNNNKRTSNTNRQDVGGGGDANNENVIGHYKNNLQLTKQIITKWPSKDQQQQVTTTIPMRIINEQKEATTSKTITTINTAAVSQTTKTTLHSIEGNKTVEASNDWQQIACGPSGRPNKVKVNSAIKVKETVENVTSLGKENVDNSNDEYDDGDADDDVDDFEQDIKSPMYTLNEPGEIIEINQTLPVSLNQLELGELIERSDDVSIGMPEPSGTESSVSGVSSIDLQLSVGGGVGANRHQSSYGKRAVVDIGAGVGKGKSNGNGSDSGSDFWA